MKMKKDIKENEIIEENGERYKVVKVQDKEIKIRYPKGRDMRFAMRKGIKSEADVIFALSSQLTCLSEEELEEMDAKDVMLITGTVMSFLE